MNLNREQLQLTNVTAFSQENYLFKSERGEIELPELLTSGKRYFHFQMQLMAEHSGTFQLEFFAKDEKTPRFFIRFGLLPNLLTAFCFDLNWLDGHILFPGNTPGALKIVCHGSRIAHEEVVRVVLSSHPCYQDLDVRLFDMYVSNEKSRFTLPEQKMVDALGQVKDKTWSGKLTSLDQLKDRLDALLQETPSYGEARTAYGALAGSEFNVEEGVLPSAHADKLKEGTGFFSKTKHDDRWYLVDPDGYPFFSLGPDCVRVSKDARIDGVESMLDDLPEVGSYLYQEFVHEQNTTNQDRPISKQISFTGMNLYKIWGSEWKAKWEKLIEKLLLKSGMNTLGNWSDETLFGRLPIPYVTSLSEFPDTKTHIFRDFPDVFSPEYKENAIVCAQSLRSRREDPLMIGYFLRNEPSWAFVDNLVLADEVMLNPEKTCCREHIIAFLSEKYANITCLNEAYSLTLSGFEELHLLCEALSKRTPQAFEDMRMMSREMLNHYIGIPAKACRKVDPNHMILGMRWAWISNPDIVSGWENFDVFSINCYAVDPTENIEQVRRLGVDLPVMIGEFHFGALDAGPTATGLEGVRTQRDRGLAFQYYCERVAAHPNGVGCHYFQLYDQFCLGRFDGENYNIGLLDICSQPYTEMLELVRASSDCIYDVMRGKRQPTSEKPDSIPMIAY